MTIAPISSGFGNYNILSVSSNPYSLSRIERINGNVRRTSPLVVMQEQEEENEQDKESLYPKTTYVASGGFADIIRMQDKRGIAGRENAMESFGRYAGVAGNRDNTGSAFGSAMPGYLKDAMNVMKMAAGNNIQFSF